MFGDFRVFPSTVKITCRQTYFSFSLKLLLLLPLNYFGITTDIFFLSRLWASLSQQLIQLPTSRNSLSLLYVCDVWVSTAAAAIHTRCRLLACFYPSRSNVAAIWELYDLFKPNGNYLIVLWFSQKIGATTKVPILHLLFTADCERFDSFQISFAAINCPFLHVRSFLGEQ